MDEANSESSFELTSDQTETVLQFQELTGIEDLDRCKDILQQQNWDLEIAVRLTLDSVDSNANSAANNEPSVRHRHLVANTSRDNETNTSHANNNTVNNNNNVEYRRAETRLTVWSFIARVISSPFAFIYDTFVSLLQFALSLIRADPTRHLHSSGDTNRFRAEFELKYGSTHPDFFVGTYNQAVDAAKRELRFLLVYLHCESHEDTDQFCRSVIISQRFIDFLTQHNVIFWASSVNYTEGYSVSQQLRESTYPFVALIALKNNRMTVVRKLEAITHLEPLLAQLNASVEHNRSSLLQELREREERNMNQLLRQQQDIDYEQSLAVDRERERLRLEEKARLDAEEEAKRRVELEASERLERMLRLREYLVGELPAEPEPNDPNATHIVIKLPNGPRLERRFLKTECIKYLYYFVYCNKDAPLKFAIRTNFPATNIPGHSPRLEDFTFADDHNRTITSVKTDAPELTLLDAKLGSRELLLVQDLDA